jgi:DNA-binding beta-propeller fold protein YncE
MRFSGTVTDSFLLFVDPYHKQIYQQSVADNDTASLVNGSRPEVQGVAVPHVEFPISVEVDSDRGTVYWIDADVNRIASSDVMGNQYRIIYKASSGMF